MGVRGGTTFTAVPLAVQPALEATLGAAGTVTAARSGALAATVSLYPNLAHGSFRVNVGGAISHAAVASLLNSLGQEVQSSRLTLNAAGDIGTIDVSRLPPGVYALQVRVDSERVVKRLVVK